MLFSPSVKKIKKYTTFSFGLIMLGIGAVFEKENEDSNQPNSSLFV